MTITPSPNSVPLSASPVISLQGHSVTANCRETSSLHSAQPRIRTSSKTPTISLLKRACLIHMCAVMWTWWLRLLSAGQRKEAAIHGSIIDKAFLIFSQPPHFRERGGWRETKTKQKGYGGHQETPSGEAKVMPTDCSEKEITLPMLVVLSLF